MKLFVGTSGWMYPWNEGNSLKWYYERTGLNAVELNMSFYRFPNSRQINSWSKYKLSWSIKVNRLITHTYKLNEKGIELLRKFIDIVKPLNPDNLLFQLPPSYSAKNADHVIDVINSLKLHDIAVVEPRHLSWFEEKIYSLFRKNDITLASIDSPLGVYIVNTTGKIYLRMHGRTEWYMYDYSVNEIVEDINKIMDLKPEVTYVFFNNDLWMLENAKILVNMFKNRGIELTPLRGDEI
ncbi:MAG: DUF72 domain-containing protein [Sulfolobaceae archaeon]|nr:DUF72 domain-containing protein [Sulfolobaceae archaeon]